MLRTVKTEVFYPYPQEQVWQVLTSRQALAAWLMENDFEPRVGHKFHFRTHSLPGLDGIIYCQVLELDEPKRLSYTWQDSLMHQPSIVTWTLKAVDGGTQLQLQHQVVETLPVTSVYEAISSAFTWHEQFMYKSTLPNQKLAKATNTSFPACYTRTDRFSKHPYEQTDKGVKPTSTPYGKGAHEESDNFFLSSYLIDEWDVRLQQKLPQALTCFHL
jgi:uncharacterized protein YndB with AHSA1/START domain